MAIIIKKKYLNKKKLNLSIFWNQSTLCQNEFLKKYMKSIIVPSLILHYSGVST